MEVWFRWFSFSIDWFLGYPFVNFQGYIWFVSPEVPSNHPIEVSIGSWEGLSGLSPKRKNRWKRLVLTWFGPGNQTHQTLEINFGRSGVAWYGNHLWFFCLFPNMFFRGTNLQPWSCENSGTLGMVPLIINPVYTLYSGYLLGRSPFIRLDLICISPRHQDAAPGFFDMPPS